MCGARPFLTEVGWLAWRARSAGALELVLYGVLRGCIEIECIARSRGLQPNRNRKGVLSQVRRFCTSGMQGL
jgi:hypothetical protein